MGYALAVHRVAPPPRMAGFRRAYGRRGLGQLSLWQDVKSIFTPNPGGGQGIDSSGNPVYVNSAGLDQSQPPPTDLFGNSFAGSYNPLDILTEDVMGVGNAALDAVLPTSLADTLLPNPQDPATPDAQKTPLNLKPILIGAGVLLGLTVLYGIYRGVKG